jgi:hypothetical protein
LPLAFLLDSTRVMPSRCVVVDLHRRQRRVAVAVVSEARRQRAAVLGDDVLTAAAQARSQEQLACESKASAIEAIRRGQAVPAR